MREILPTGNRTHVQTFTDDFYFFFPFKFNFFVDCNVSRGSLMLVELLSKEEKKPQTYKDYLKVVANSR